MNAARREDTNARPRLRSMRLSAEEDERAHLVADHYGLTVSGVFRMLLKREAERIAREERDSSDQTPRPKSKR